VGRFSLTVIDDMIGSLFHKKWKLTEHKIYICIQPPCLGSCIKRGSGQGFLKGCLWTLTICSSVCFLMIWSGVRIDCSHVIVQMVVVQKYCILMGYFLYYK